MYSVEHDFDATVVTLIDEGKMPLEEDVRLNVFEDCVTLQQHDPRTQQDVTITLSLQQVRDLGASLNSPEGIFTTAPETE